MNEIPGKLFDGKVSAQQDVLVTVTPMQVVVAGVDFRIVYTHAAVTLSDALGSTPRAITLPDGSRIEVPSVPQLQPLQGRSSALASLVDGLESRWPLALACLALLVASLWATFRFGIPVLAEHAAFQLPKELDTALGEQVLAVLDDAVFESSTLSAVRQRSLRNRFGAVAQTLLPGSSTELVFRSSAYIGANAFALPSGIVVVTDELIALADSDEEIVAVLAHEIGHVSRRHAIRLLLQNSAVVALLVTLNGDLVSVTSLAATLPAIIVQTSYSRDFEREADDIAYAYLASAGIPATRFGNILRKLEASASGNGQFSYLSTHPDTAERIRE